jgi:hypothetical protein
VLAVALLVATAALWPAGPVAASSPSPPGAAVLRVGWTSDPDNLNPFVGWASASFEVLWRRRERAEEA